MKKPEEKMIQKNFQEQFDKIDEEEMQIMEDWDAKSEELNELEK